MRTLRGIAAFIATLVLCSTANAGNGYFQVNPSFITYCSPVLCSPPAGSAVNPVLDDGKTVIYLETIGGGTRGYVQIWITGFSSDPGAGYIQYLQIDNCAADSGNTHYYNTSSPPFSYNYSNG